MHFMLLIMALRVWEKRVSKEYKKILAFDKIERKKKISNAWQNNWAELDNNIMCQPKVKWCKLNPGKKNTIHYLTDCSMLPPMNNFVLVTSNEKSKEEKKLYNIPWLGSEEPDQFLSELIECYDGQVYNEKSLGLMEDHIFLKLLKKLQEKYLSRKLFPPEIIFQAISSYFSGKVTPKALAEKYAELITNENIEETNNYSSAFLRLFCRRCFKYGCNLHKMHGENEEIKAKEKEQFSFNSELIQKPTNPCMNDCFLLKNVENIDGADEMHRDVCIKDEPVNNEDWLLEDLELFEKLRNIFQDNCCVIAQSMMNKSCQQVYDLIIEKKAESERTLFIKPKLKSVSKTKRYRTAYNKFMAMKNETETKRLCEYKPCSHSDNQICNADCICIKSKNFCEKYCGCSNDCVIRFPGCKCKTYCNSNRCPCYSAGRECDPDLCKACGADNFKLEEIVCKNVNLQRGRRKHLLLAPSDVAGWGIFIKYGVHKREFISEYCGEIISQDEANRRGKVYDKAKCSFLFDLNEEYVIDATRKGSKIRFANHSIRPNCYAKVLMVNGDHRIGIFAKRDILPGEEIFFDYQYGTNERLTFVGIEK